MSIKSDDSEEITIIKNLIKKSRKQSKKSVKKKIIEIESSEETDNKNVILENKCNFDNINEINNNNVVEEITNCNKEHLTNEVKEDYDDEMQKEFNKNNVLVEEINSSTSPYIKRVKPNTSLKQTRDLFSLSATMNIESFNNAVSQECSILSNNEEIINYTINETKEMTSDNIKQEDTLKNNIKQNDTLKNNITQVDDLSLTEQDISNNNLQTDKDCPVILRGSDGETKYFLKDDSLLEDLFEISGITKIKYRGIPVSKYLNLNEIGYTKDFPYFDIIEDGSSEFNLKINLDFFTTKTLKINKNKKVVEIIKMCKKEGVIVMNGIIIDENKKLREVFENDDIIDIVNINYK